MIIDFHTHMFPDKIATRTIEHLEAICGTKADNYGTADELIESSVNAGVDCSVVLPVATKPEQFSTINKFASRFQEGVLLSFGSIHPESDQIKSQVKEIKSMGMKGIKIHPDYQGTDFNDIRYKRILALASEYDLVVSVHAGFDPLSKDHVHCTPKMALEVIREVRPTKLVLAHLGGNQLWDDVENYLVGEEVYFDTAVIFSEKFRISDEQFLRIFKNHGKEKILFGTDIPWGSQGKFIYKINELPLSEEEKKYLFEYNAKRLLNL